MKLFLFISRIILVSLASFLLCPSNSLANDQDSVQVEKTQQEPVQMDFLSGYYQQDGHHSAVTGGEGSEALKDFATVIKIHIPISQKKSLQLDTRVNYFTSASSDNIDPRTVSGASKQDVKVNIQARVNRTLKRNSKELFYELGAAHEAHFASINLGLGMSGILQEGQTKWLANASYTMDTWGPHYRISKLYPSDYFGPDDLNSNKRHTLNTAIGMERIINSSVNLSVSVGVIQQFGLLSTPFHRIYFNDNPRIDIERLPNYRFRMPVSGRLNAHLTDWLVLRTYYRFYWDNFELKSHSAYVELPVKPISQLTLYPFYRFHAQSGHQYFGKKGMHAFDDAYYTSDFDQADLQSHFIGGGFRWTPFIAKRKKPERRISFQAVEARGAYYIRSDGFSSWMVSAGVSWAILRKGEQ